MDHRYIQQTTDLLNLIQGSSKSVGFCFIRPQVINRSNCSFIAEHGTDVNLQMTSSGRTIFHILTAAGETDLDLVKRMVTGHTHQPAQCTRDHPAHGQILQQSHTDVQNMTKLGKVNFLGPFMAWHLSTMLPIVNPLSAVAFGGLKLRRIVPCMETRAHVLVTFARRLYYVFWRFQVLVVG